MYRYYWCVKWYTYDHKNGIVESTSTGHYDLPVRCDADQQEESVSEAFAEREGLAFGQIYYVHVDVVEYEQ